MKALLSRRTIVILSTALLLTLISIISVNVLGNSGPVTGFAGVITTPIRSLASLIAQPFSRIFLAMYEYEQAMIEIESLKAQVSELHENTRMAQEYREENDRLRRQLGFQESRYGGYQNQMVSFKSWGSDNWTSTFTIDRGSANSNFNISPGMPVITDSGFLLGQIGDVGLTESTVITILDTRFSAAAYVGREDMAFDYEADSSVVAKGDFAYMASGMLLLDQIGDEYQVRRGDLVITSGIADVFPPGLIIGEVQDVIRHASGIGRYAPISPGISFNNLSMVWIITDYDAPSDD